MKYDCSFVIAVDFDGTINKNKSPSEEIVIDREAVDALNKIENLGCTLILWTCREGYNLKNAVDALEVAGITFDYINDYPLREYSRKINADFYIDDKSWTKKIDWKEIVDYIEQKVAVRASSLL